jgi:hypothetical protein
MWQVNLDFVDRMQRELEANAHKGDWLAWQPDRYDLYVELRHHSKKLLDAIHSADHNLTAERAADLANLCMKAWEMAQKNVTTEVEPKSVGRDANDRPA